MKKEIKAPVAKTKAIELSNNDKRQLTFLINDIDILSDISKLCIKEAVDSEFQLGYEGLHIRVKKFNKVVNFMIPVTYYNFKQEVTVASVEYELTDVTAAYEAIKGATDIEQLSGLMASIKMLEGLGYEIEFKMGDFGSIHRHPTRSGFSSIDLKNDPESPGIIYRKSDFKGLQVDSIIYIPGVNADITDMFHAEAREVDIKSSDKGVEGTYQKHDCHIVYFCDRGYVDDSPISFEDVLNFKEEIIEVDKEDIYYYVNNEEIDNTLLKSIMLSYKESGFKPSYDTVDPKNITQQVVDIKTYNRDAYLDKYYNATNMKDFYPSLDDDDEDIESFKMFTKIELEDIISGSKEEIEDLVEDVSTSYHDPALRYKNMLFDRYNNFSEVKEGVKYTLVNYKEDMVL